jgi:hypothetical protein
MKSVVLGKTGMAANAINACPAKKPLRQNQLAKSIIDASRQTKLFSVFECCLKEQAYEVSRD